MPTKNRLTVSKVTPAYWRAVIENPPINLYDPEMFAELNVLMDTIDLDTELKVLVFESANPDYFVAHYDLERAEVIPDQPGAAEFSAWPKFVTRLAQSRVVSVAKLRGRARAHGSELALACDMRFASRENAVLAQVEVGAAVVPGGGATEWLCALAGRSRALEIICGANDFDADTAEKYGWVNRSIPDAELDDFVDDFARRVASFEKRALELAKKLVNARAGRAVGGGSLGLHSAVLKNAIDWVYPEWNRKAAGFVSYGSAMGARSVQQLRQTLIEIQVAPIRSSVHIPVATLWAHYQGADVDAGLAELAAPAGAMIDDLLWWTAALKTARANAS